MTALRAPSHATRDLTVASGEPAPPRFAFIDEVTHERRPIPDSLVWEVQQQGFEVVRIDAAEQLRGPNYVTLTKKSLVHLLDLLAQSGDALEAALPGLPPKRRGPARELVARIDRAATTRRGTPGKERS
jgi:hypothetical protein